MMDNNAPSTKLTDVLIVEDDHMLNRVMTLQVQFAGYTVRSAKSGTAALAMIKERVPSVLILDVGLPDMTGQQLVAELRLDQLTCALPLIVHTTLDLSEDEKSDLRLGCSKFVTKATAFSDQLGELVAELSNLSNLANLD